MGIRIGGLSTGLDTAALIDAFIRFERRPLDLVEARKASVEKEKGLFRDLNTKLQALSDAAAAIDNLNSTLSGPVLDEELLAFQVSSSKDTVLTGNATGNATPGTVDVEVVQVAKVGRRFSAAFSAKDTVVANAGETLSIDYGGLDAQGNPKTIDITAGASGETLETLKTLINEDANNEGNVRADILFDGTSYRLVISGAKTGVANDVNVTTTISGPGGSPFIDTALTQTAQDSQINVFGGIAISRSDNDINDVLPGLTLKLHSEDPGNPVTLDVTRDDEKISEKLQAFVDAYNDVVDFVNQQSRFDETSKKAGPLSGNPTLRRVQSTLQQALQGSSSNPYQFSGNPLRSVGEFGIELGSDGKLSLNQTELTEALDTDPFNVREFLSGDGTQLGAASSMVQAIDPFIESVTGIMAGIDETLQDRIQSFETQIERMQERLDRREELLVQRFSRLESSIAALQAQGNSLSGLLIGSTGR